MTVSEAITITDEDVHNTYSRAEKLRWLQTVESILVTCNHWDREGKTPPELPVFTQNTPDDTPLLAPGPFDQMYLYYLEAQIHYYNGELERYNNAIAMYQMAIDAYRNFYNRRNIMKRIQFTLGGKRRALS